MASIKAYPNNISVPTVIEVTRATYFTFSCSVIVVVVFISCLRLLIVIVGFRQFS